LNFDTPIVDGATEADIDERVKAAGIPVKGAAQV